MKASQLGASSVFIAFVIIVLAVLITGIATFTHRSTTSANSSGAEARMRAIQESLEQYASVARRLPCPADPTSDLGDEKAGATTGKCDFPAGTVPWKTIGLRIDDGVDAWGSKISYRVYTGPTATNYYGSLTQPNGISMVDCDTVQPPPGALTSTGTCDPNQDSDASFFITLTKGLSIASAPDDIAYVLISHGPTGQGAYASGGGQRLPLPSGNDEQLNLTARGPFTIKTASDPSILLSDPLFYDDVIIFRRLPELIQRTGLLARDWLNDPIAPITTSSILLNAATVAAAVGHGVAFGDNLNQASIDFGTATVSGYRSGTRTSDLAFDDGVTGTTGAGVGGLGITRGNTLISSSRSEFLRVDFDTKAAKLGITLNNFGIYTSGGRVYTEQVQLTFYNAGAPVGSPIVKAGCAGDGGLASFSLDAPGLYDRVDVTPVSSTAPGGHTSTTSFLVSSFAACSAGAGACHSPLETINPASVCP
jgi:type II secretory pathway pseudopilin PulG